MTEENKQKSDLQKALDLHEEIESWRDEMTNRLIALHDQIDEAEEANNQKLIDQLNEKLDVLRSVKQAGYSKAETSEHGREILDYVREQKKASDAKLSAYRKKQKELNNSSN